MRILAGTVAVAALFAATAARADVTAEQVWDQWKEVAANGGQTITATSQDKKGDTLRLKGVKTVAEHDSGASFTGTLDEVDLREMGDGSVQITMSPDYPVVFDAEGDDGKSMHMTLNIHQQGLKITATGSPGDTRYDIDAPEITFDLPNVEADGRRADLKASGKLTALKASYAIKGSDTMHVSSTFAARHLTVALSATKPEDKGGDTGAGAGTGAGGGTLTFNAEAKDLGGSSESTMIKGTSMNMMDAALKAGATVDAKMGVGSMTYDFAVDENGKQTQGNGSVADGKLTVGLSKERMHYGTSSGASDLTLSGSEMPVPKVSLALAKTAFDMVLPLMKDDAKQPFSLMLALGGVKPSDEIWSMIDPGNVLPHDPAELEVDLGGMVTLARDLFGTETATAPMDPPGQIDSVDIRKVHVAAAGADLSGTGAFTFDNSMGPQPVPEGSVDLTLKGGMELIDNLVKMGFVPEDQAAGTKMMLGLFAKPGDGPDTMTSKIEVKKDGQILANGQRIK
ncbi:DUF2125 domain-containing protein [Acidimangrovimonas sediminis]|uniref:DUF2125 domain-containing protein n=1 Tax=Acidimangrovimonas sediminis TaxID=2056283 RepID=UPI000C800AAA|nr:DUF2125 domain-containing protein [Acidimangrovimonas sediminis]